MGLRTLSNWASYLTRKTFLLFNVSSEFFFSSKPAYNAKFVILNLIENLSSLFVMFKVVAFLSLKMDHRLGGLKARAEDDNRIGRGLTEYEYKFL